jgi:type I restriction enzyme R subunit
MQNPSFQEDHSSQIPALQLLINMGYTYLNPNQALEARGNKTANVLLEAVLKKQLKRINSAKLSSHEEVQFTDGNIEQAVLALKNVALVDGFQATAQKIYELLTLGFSVEQNVGANIKTFDINFIDWKNISNNVFHVIFGFTFRFK